MDFYIPGTSRLHRLHPGAKILALLILSISPLALSRPAHLLLPLGLAITLTLISGASRHLRSVGPYVVLFCVLTVVLWSLLRREGLPVFQWFFLSVSRESFQYGVGMALRLLTLSLFGIVFLTLTSVEAFSDGCQSLGMGYRASFALSLSFRLVPRFFTTIHLVVLAQKSRGLDLGTRSLIGRVSGYLPLFVPIITHALRDADGLALALDCRGFGSGPRRSMEETRWSGGDISALLAVVGVAAASLYVRAAFSG